MRKLLLGDEAIAQAAIDSGLSGVYAYPGTPSTEITEFIQLREEKRGEAQDKIFCRWATNEKTAMEGALGMSYMGKRALVCMKHVGMNVAADPFVNSAMTGVNGGLVVVAADDPSMHSSQNEQDSRFYGKFAMMPIFEPSSQQEAYEMTRAAFDLSEAVKLPVLMRVTTRMAHSRAVVNVTEEPRKQNEINRVKQLLHRGCEYLPAGVERYVQSSRLKYLCKLGEKLRLHTGLSPRKGHAAILDVRIKPDYPLCELCVLHRIRVSPLPRVGIVTVRASERTALSEHHRAHARSVNRAERLQAVNIPLHPLHRLVEGP